MAKFIKLNQVKTKFNPGAILYSEYTEPLYINIDKIEHITAAKSKRDRDTIIKSCIKSCIKTNNCDFEVIESAEDVMKEIERLNAND